MARRSFVAGNWKMNKTPPEAHALTRSIRSALEGFSRADVAICPPFVCLSSVGEVLNGSNLWLGAQNVYWEKAGAFTGEISVGMLAACGVRTVILGHSERRQFFGETDATVNRRLKAVLAGGLQAILCVGETLAERESDRTEAVVRTQLLGGLADLAASAAASLTIAYEPVWAIGTGRNASPSQAQAVHLFIRGLLRERLGGETAEAIRIQYGGSVKAANARELLSQPDIDGALVGGASLTADEFVAIVNAAR